MPSQTGTSSVLAKLGPRAREVAAAHATKEPELPNMGLPPGIENGIAQVVECKFGIVEPGKKNPGATYFMVQGIVKEPQSHKGITVTGRRTMLYKEVADAKGNINQRNMEWAQDQLKMLVGKGADPNMFLLDRMEATAALIRQAKPHTLFRTFVFDKQDVRNLDAAAAQEFKVKPGWYLCNLNDSGSVKAPSKDGEGKLRGPYPTEQAARSANQYAGREPLVNQQWCGAVKYDPPSVNGQPGVIDETSSAEPAASTEPTGHDDAEPSTEYGPADQFNEFQDDQQTSGQTTEPSIEGDRTSDRRSEDVDLDALAAEAYHDAAAQNRLNDLAVAAGVDAAEVNKAEKWEDVVAMIRSAQATGSEESTSEETAEESAKEPWTPVKGEVCWWYPKQPNGKPVLNKSKKPQRTEVVILSTDAKSSTATIQDNATKKPVLGANKKPLVVKWDDLAVE